MQQQYYHTTKFLLPNTLQALEQLKKNLNFDLYLYILSG